MGCSYMIGKIAVTSEELEENFAIGAVKHFLSEAASTIDATLKFRGGDAIASEVLSPAFWKPDLLPAALDFEPIGIGKPIGIEILTVYTGDAPSTAIFGGKPDLLVTSAVKSVQTFDAAPRAINQIVQKINDNAYIVPSAVKEGAPIVYYSSSLVNTTTLCTFELVAETFQKKIFERISGLFSVAAGLPIFAPASAYLLAGSFLIKILADIGKALVESNPFLSADMNLKFDTPGFEASIARRAYLYNERDRGEFANYIAVVKNIDSGGKQMAVLVHKDSGKEYKGNAPYIIVNIDGRERPELKDFTSKLASAALLERFYGTTDVAGKVVEAIDSAMKLYNDFTFQKKAEEIKKTLKSYSIDSDMYKKAKELFDAYNKNISNDLFKISLEN